LPSGRLLRDPSEAASLYRAPGRSIRDAPAAALRGRPCTRSGPGRTMLRFEAAPRS